MVTLAALTTASAGFPLSAAANSGDFSLWFSIQSFCFARKFVNRAPSATLTVTSLNNFVGTVALTVSGLPPGVSSIPSSPFNMNATIGYPLLTFLAFTASNTVAPGRFSNYRARCEWIAQSFSELTLNVNTPSDFNLLISPSGISVAPGATSSPRDYLHRCPRWILRNGERQYWRITQWVTTSFPRARFLSMLQGISR